MDFNKRYKNDLDFIKKLLHSKDESRSEAIIAGKLGKGSTFFTDRKRNNKEYTEGDLVWLHYNYGHFLENPIIKKMEVVESENDVNSGSPGHDPGTFLELISKKQKELADEIDVFLKAYSEHSSKSGSQVSKVKDLQRKLDGTAEEGGKSDRPKGNKS